MEYSIKNAIERGVRRLDERDPGWLDRAHAATLDMAFHGLCLLSQLYGSFADGIEYLDLADPFGGEVQDYDGWQYGFTLPPTPSGSLGLISSNYARLTEEWRTIIAHKQEILPSHEQAQAKYVPTVQNVELA